MMERSSYAYYAVIGTTLCSLVRVGVGETPRVWYLDVNVTYSVRFDETNLPAKPVISVIS